MMTSSTSPSSDAAESGARTSSSPDLEQAAALIDEEAASIDARDPDVAEQIAELAADADDLGLPTPDPSEVDTTVPATPDRDDRDPQEVAEETSHLVQPDDPMHEPPNSTVDDWFGQRVQADADRLDEALGAGADPADRA